MAQKTQEASTFFSGGSHGDQKGTLWSVGQRLLFPEQQYELAAYKNQSPWFPVVSQLVPGSPLLMKGLGLSTSGKGEERLDSVPWNSSQHCLLTSPF